MNSLWKPMLACSKTPDFKTLRFPLYASPKLDGIRATVQNGRLYSRSLKLIPNKNVQAKFAGLPDGLDGELIHGDPWDDPYRRTVSVVMSDDKPAEGVNFYVFDIFGEPSFRTRLEMLGWISNQVDHIRLVPQVVVVSVEELEAAEKEYLERGYEGAIIRSPNGPYKQGRSTEGEGYLMKVKRFVDAEARIVGFYEEQENQNVATVNELGRTARSSHKAGKVGKGTLGGFTVKGVGGTYDNVEFSVGGGFTAAQRASYWEGKEMLKDELIVYKYFPTGADTRPRHPIWKGLRDVRDL